MNHEAFETAVFVGYWVVAALVLGVLLSQLDSMNKGLETKGKKPIDVQTTVFAAVIWPVSLLIIIGQKIGDRWLGK